MSLSVGKPPPRGSRAGRRTLRGVLLFLLLWFLLWLVIGSVIRIRMERPVRFIGRAAKDEGSSAFAALPLHLGQACAVVLDASHHEQEVGQAV
jgi:hypothetical protein